MSLSAFPSSLNEIEQLDPRAPATAQLYPRRKGENIVFGQDVCVVEMGKNLVVKGLSHYGNRILGGEDQGNVHLVDENFSAVTAETLSVQEEIHQLFKNHGKPELLPIYFQNGSLMSSVLLLTQDDARKKIGRALPALLEKTAMLVPFYCSPDSKKFTREVPALMHNPRKIELESSPASATLLNHKWFALEALRQKGVKTLYNRFANNRSTLWNALQDVLQTTNVKSVFVKECMSASGCGIIKLEGPDEIEKFMAEVRDSDLQKGVIVEQGLAENEIETNCGLVIHVKPGTTKGKPKVTLIAASDQLIAPDGKTHMGNIWPMNKWYPEMENVLLKYAELADELGGRGMMGLDFLNQYPTDPNGRFTGSTHPALILHKYGVNPLDPDISWLSDNNFKIPVDFPINELVKDLQSENLLLTDINRPGVIIANHATHGEGKTQLVFVSPVNPQWSTKDRRKPVLEIWNRFKSFMLRKYDLR